MIASYLIIYPFTISAYVNVSPRFLGCIENKNLRSAFHTHLTQLEQTVLNLSSNQGIDDELYKEASSLEKTPSSSDIQFDNEEALLLKDQDYSRFSSESFTALKDLASASLSIILSANTALINATSEMKDWGTYVKGQNLWSSEIESISNSSDQASTVIWDVYVCQSKSSRERGSSATLEAFQTLAPPNLVQIHPAILSKTKSKGPTVRIIHRNLETIAATNTSMYAFEVNNVDSIDKVYRILTNQMNLSEDDVKPAAKECLKWIYRGNALMEQNVDEQISDEVIYAYTAALKTNHKPQKGIILLLRATAYLKRAFYHQKILKATVNDLSAIVPDPTKLSRILYMAAENPTLGPFIFQQIMNDCRVQEKKFRQTKFRHGLYEYALLHAAQDALQATQILPYEAQAWLRAADALAELRKLKESIQYYDKAIALDSNLENSLRPVIQRLHSNQEFLEKARALGWSEDTLRLALDVS